MAAPVKVRDASGEVAELLIFLMTLTKAYLIRAGRAGDVQFIFRSPSVPGTSTTAPYCHCDRAKPLGGTAMF